MRTISLLVFVLVGNSACIDALGSDSNPLDGEKENGEEGDDFDMDECKIEGGQIGEEGVVVSLGSKSVVVHDWIGKADSAGEYVGFSLTVNADSISYVVKAGGELHPSSATAWSHPNGDAGSEVPGISNVDFCEECEDGDCGGGDPGCDNPDGCDGGGGDGGDGCDDPDGCPDSGDSGGSGPLL